MAHWLQMLGRDVPTPIDFTDPAQARAWEADTIASRPARPMFFDAFVTALNALMPRRPLAVLELGSGPGHLAEQILKRCDVARYAALDFSSAMNAMAAVRLGPLAEKVTFLPCDFREPKWAEGLHEFDAVVTQQAAHELRHRRRLPALLQQTRGCLRKGGLFLYCDHYAEAGSGKNPYLYLPPEAQGPALVKAGFAEPRKLLDAGGMALWGAVNPG